MFCSEREIDRDSQSRSWILPRGVCFHHDEETGRYWEEGEEGEFSRVRNGGIIVEIVDRKHVHTGNLELTDVLGKPVEKGKRLSRSLAHTNLVDIIFDRREELVSLGIDENGVFGHFHDGVYPELNL